MTRRAQMLAVVNRVPRDMRLALVILATAFLTALLSGVAPWLSAWPAGWTLPITDWVGSGLSVALEAIKPAARALSALLAYPMNWANWLLVHIPWPLTVALATALGWHLGGLRLAALALAGLGFVVLSGYWEEGMNTLALVSVSVPLALSLGLAIGLLAHEIPGLRGPIQSLLDVMQTVPTFAYLTPLLLLFGFGPVVGLIASAIYAAPPMARNVLLGLDRTPPDIREAAIMAGATRPQQLVQVEIPGAASQILIGVNQSLMAALSMVIIAAVIGGFDDIGWEVLLTMRKAQFGNALLAGLVIVAFAIVIDRLSARLAQRGPQRFDPRVAWGIIGTGTLAALLVAVLRLDPADLGVLGSTASTVDTALGTFTSNSAATLDGIKNTAMFYFLLPLRIGLGDAVLPFTWGFVWTPMMTVLLYGAAFAIAGLCAWLNKPKLGFAVLLLVFVAHVGVSQLPWPFVLLATGAAAWRAGGWPLASICVGLLGFILLAGLWERALLSVYLSGAAVLACALVGGILGLLAALSKTVWAILLPICDMLQTIPLFVFLIPVLMFFQIGEFSAFLAICAYAIVPMIRYTRAGLLETPPDLLEAAIASGATPWQIIRDVRGPYAAPTILLGLNQTILYAFAMLVIAALIGTTGLGQSIYLAVGQADVGLGVTAGAAMAMLAYIADRLVQGMAREQRARLGL